MDDLFEDFSKALGLVLDDYIAKGISDAEAIGALRLMAAVTETKATGGKLTHVNVVEVQIVDEDGQDVSDDADSWKYQ